MCGHSELGQKCNVHCGYESNATPKVGLVISVVQYFFINNLIIRLHTFTLSQTQTSCGMEKIWIVSSRNAHAGQRGRRDTDCVRRTTAGRLGTDTESRRKNDEGKQPAAAWKLETRERTRSRCSGGSGHRLRTTTLRRVRGVAGARATETESAAAAAAAAAGSSCCHRPHGGRPRWRVVGATCYQLD